MTTALIILLTAALIAALVRIWLVKRDVRKMARRLNEITLTDTNAQLTTETFDRDVSEMARQINAMLKRNRENFAEKIRFEADLKRAVTNISHDLRTPLTSALGYLQMLPEQKYLEIIKGRLDALSALMNSLFEFAQVTEGNTPMEMEKVNVGSLLRDAISSVYSDLIGKGFAVETDIPDAPVIWIINRDALNRIAQNLIKNVCVHGRDFLRVSLTDVAIEISNKADGVETLDPVRMFDRFYTADAARTGKNTGLGLAIVKELANRTGIKVSAEVKGDIITVKIELNR